MTPSLRPLSVALLSVLPLAASGPAIAQEQPALSKTTIETGLPRAPEQEAVVFEPADVKFMVYAAGQRSDG